MCDDLGGPTDYRSGCCQRCCQLVDHVDPRRQLVCRCVAAPVAAARARALTVQRATMHGLRLLPTTRNPTVAAKALGAWVSSRLIDESSVSDSGASKPQHCAVSGPACRLRCRPTALAPPNRLLRKLLAEEGLPRAAHHQARNPPGLRPLGPLGRQRNSSSSRRGIPPCSRRRGRPGSNSGSSGSSGGRSDTGLPTVCCLCTTQIRRTASLVATPPPSLRRSDRTVTMVDVNGSRTSVGLELSRLER